MPQRIEMRIIESIKTPAEDERILLVEDKETNQVSFEPLHDITLDIVSKALTHFSARSLGRHVTGFYNANQAGEISGEVDFLTPLAPGEMEEY